MRATVDGWLAVYSRGTLMAMDDTPWIVATPGTLGGKPCVRGTRISVAFILELVASGASRDAILAAYPYLPAEGLDAALRYAATTMDQGMIWDLKVSA